MTARVPDHLRKRAPGAGAKPAGYVPPPERIEYEAARTRNEKAKADLNELEYQVKLGTYVLRAEVQQAAATALANLSQTLRSVPDNLERKLGLAPDVAQEVGYLIDAALNEVANAFEKASAEAAEELGEEVDE